MTRDWWGWCYSKLNFLLLFEVPEAVIALAGTPIMIIEAHFEGSGQEKLHDVLSAFIPFCPICESFQLNLFKLTKNSFKEFFFANVVTLLVTNNNENYLSFSKFAETRKISLNQF